MSAGAYFPWYAFDDDIYEECTDYYDEAASLTVLAGTPVIKDSNGRIDAAGTSPSVLYGVALEAGHNTTATPSNRILVARFRPSDVWVIPVLEAMALNMFGLSGGDVGIVKDATTGLWYGSTNDAGAQARIIHNVKAPAGLTIGDTKWAAKVIFHSTKLQVV